MRSGFSPAQRLPDTGVALALRHNGLVFGHGTQLVRFADGGERLALYADRDRCLTMLSVVAGRPVTRESFGPIEAAATYWQQGDRTLANLRLVFAGLPKLRDAGDAARLRAAEYLLDEGMAPNALMKELGLDASALDLGKFDPDQPRVPAGSGRESGRRTDEGDLANTPDESSRANIILAADQTTPGGIVYGKKIQDDMKARTFTPEQIDEAVRSGSRIDAINRATGGPAVRYVNPTTGQSVVIDSTTNRAIHVGDPTYKYRPNSGDVPGATMKAPPVTSQTPAPLVEEPVTIPDVILPP